MDCAVVIVRKSMFMLAKNLQKSQISLQSTPIANTLKSKIIFHVLTIATAEGLKSNTNTNLYLLARKVTFVEGRILQNASSVIPSSDSLLPDCIDWTARMCNSSLVHTLTKI